MTRQARVKTPHPFGRTAIRLEGKFVNENNLSMHSTDSPYDIEPGDQSVSDQNCPAEKATFTMGQPPSRQNLRARSSWAISYRASLLAFLVLAALTCTQCDFREIPDWKPVLALADAARRRGDLDHAKHLYLQAGKFAVWRDDWAGLLAAAYGIKQLERNPYSSANALLLRAMVAAQKKQSQSGLVAVAKAFSTLGENKVASMVLSFVEDDRVEETSGAADIASPGCWDD